MVDPGPTSSFLPSYHEQVISIISLSEMLRTGLNISSQRMSAPA
jgi:hypothetical protein